MTKDIVEQIIGRAVMDEEFRELLFSSPEKALAGYNLTDQQRDELAERARREFGDLADSTGKQITGGKFIY